jgi:dienelactone hydrolase
MMSSRHIGFTVSAIFMALMVFMSSCSKDDTMMQYLQVPEDYVFEAEVKAVGTYEFDHFDAELLLQKNGPDTWQRVLKVFPKEYEGRLPAVVVPFYFPEAMLGSELDGTPLPKYAGIEMMAHLASRGFACISADAYHLTYVDNDKPRDAFSRWSDAGSRISEDYPRWCGIGKLTADTRLLVDLLEEDPRVDAGRIGIAGHSLGGKMAFYAGCMDRRIKAIMVSDFGFLWDQSNWEKSWYWGDKIMILKEKGLSNIDMLSASGRTPVCLIAGQYDTDESFAAMKKAAGYKAFPERLEFINHASGHRPPAYALEAGYDFLEKHLK